MYKYKITKPGLTKHGLAIGFADMISVVQRRAGINVTGELDFDTKKLFVIPRCGVTEKEDEPHRYRGRATRKGKRDIRHNYIENIRKLIKVSVKFSIGSVRI